MSQLVSRQRPFPSFADVRADLRLAELNIGPPSPSALVTAPSFTPPSTPALVPPRHHQATAGQQATAGHHAAAGQQSSSTRGHRRHRSGRGSVASQSSTQGSTAPATLRWPSLLNPWTGSIHMWLGSTAGVARGPPPRAAQPTPLQQALVAGVPPAYFTPPPASRSYYPQPPQAPPAWTPWTPEGLANAFSTVSLTPPPSSSDWVIDSGASSHITANPGMVTATPSSSFPSSIVVGNGATLPVIGTGYSVLPGPFRLNNVLVAPDIIRNLLSVRKFTTDNSISVEFDPLGVSMKDLCTRNTLLRCNSTGPLYTL